MSRTKEEILKRLTKASMIENYTDNGEVYCSSDNLPGVIEELADLLAKQGEEIQELRKQIIREGA